MKWYPLRYPVQNGTSPQSGKPRKRGVEIPSIYTHFLGRIDIYTHFLGRIDKAA